MLKLGTLIPAALIVALIFFGWAEKTFSPSFQECVTEHSQNHQEHTTKENNSTFKINAVIYVSCSGRFLNKHDGAITALATILLAVITIFLVVVARNQFKTTQAQLRAYVFATNVSPNWEIHPDTGQYVWRFRPRWENSGDTPTRNMRIFVDCEFRDTTLPADFDFTQIPRPIGTGLLPPKTTMSGGAAPFPPDAAITPHDIEEIKAGRKFLFLWGWARYFDVFPGTPEHLTRFCFQILAVGDPLSYNPAQMPGQTGSLGFPYIHLPFGNCADDECAD